MTDHQIGDIWYRYESGMLPKDEESFGFSESDVTKVGYQLVEHVFKVVRVTKECVYLKDHSYFSARGGDRRVLKISPTDMVYKRYAYPTKKQALKSLVKRKSFQIWHAEHCLAMGKAAMAKAEDMLAKGEY